MKFEKITIQPLYPTGNFTNVRIGVDISLEGNDNPKEAMQIALDLTKEFHKEQYPMLYKDGKPIFSNYQGEEPTVDELKEDKPTDKIDGWIQVIELASTLTSLEKFKPTVDKANDQRLTDAYNKQMKKISG